MEQVRDKQARGERRQHTQRLDDGIFSELESVKLNG